MPTDTVYQAVVKLPAKSGIPQDTVQNSWVFQVSDNTHADRLRIRDALAAFYTVVPTGGAKAVGAYLSDTVTRAVQPDIAFYDITAFLHGAAHGSPIEDIPMGAPLPAAVGGNLPSEVAICLSFNSDYGVDVEFGPHTRPRARDRGRVYLGPLLQLAMTNDTTTRRSEVDATCRQDIAKAALALKTMSDPDWCTWSRVDGVAEFVTRAWVDDAFDTQRRRGERAVSRTFA